MITLPFCEPYKIKMIEPLTRSTREEREQWLNKAHYNLIQLSSQQVFIDCLTDSGTGAMSQYQWAKMMQGDESYAGSTSNDALKTVVKRLFGLPYFLPVHQGRAAENVLFSALIKEGDIVPGNAHFVTTQGHITLRKAQTLDLTIEQTNDSFNGNIDIEKLRHLFNTTPRKKIPLVLLTITCNNVAGQPVSMENIRETEKLCKHYNVPLFFDAARFAENAYLIKTREKNYKDKSIREIVLEMFSHVDGFMMSAKKDGIVNIGGLIGLRDEKLFDKASEFTIRYEGFINYGGLAGRDLEAMAQGLMESTDINAIESRVKQTYYLGEKCKSLGIPILEPFCGHGLFIDAKTFYEHVPEKEYRAQVLCTELYLEAGIRSSGVSALSMDRNPTTHEEIFPKREWVRLAIPWRTYTQSHLDYIAIALANVYQYRQQIKHGFYITHEKPSMRIFTVQLKRIGQ